MATSAPSHIHSALIRLQHERLLAALPFLCLMIAANALAMAGAVLGDLPWWQQAVPPGILIASCIAAWALLRLRQAPKDEAAMSVGLRRTTWLVTPLGLVAGVWAVNAFTETEKYYCMVAPVFIGIAALISATMLIAVPRAAVAAMVSAVAPITIKMASYDNLGVRAMALMLVLLTIMLAKVVHDKFAETVAMLTYQAELDRMASTDPLTGLANRRAFHNQLDQALVPDRQVNLILIDLDGFKAINDKHGHAAGDAVLTAIGNRLRLVCPDALCRARLGGDEFALIIDETVVESESELQAIISKLRAKLCEPVSWEQGNLRVDGSIGVARMPDDGSRIDTLLACADQRLYREKHSRMMIPANLNRLRVVVNG